MGKSLTDTLSGTLINEGVYSLEQPSLIPKEAYYMAGAGGQYTIIILSQDLVVVRMRHYKGSDVSFEALCKSLLVLMLAIPERGLEARQRRVQQ